MNRAAFDIDNKVLAALIVGALTYAITKLAIPLDPQLEQLINGGAAILAAYLVPSKTPAALVNEADETDDVPVPPTALESADLREQLDQLADAVPAGMPFDPDLEDEISDVPNLPGPDEVRSYRSVEGLMNGNGNGGGAATLVSPPPIESAAEIDESATYGDVNLTTGFTADEVAEELDLDALDDADDDWPPTEGHEGIRS